MFYIATDHQQRIVRVVIFVFDDHHLFRCGGIDDVVISDGILAGNQIAPHSFLHFKPQEKLWIAFRTLEFTIHHGILFHHVFFAIDGKTDGRIHEIQTCLQAVCIEGEEIVDPFFTSGAIPDHTQLVGAIDEFLLVRIVFVGLKKHVFKKV